MQGSNIHVCMILMHNPDQYSTQTVLKNIKTICLCTCLQLRYKIKISLVVAENLHWNKLLKHRAPVEEIKKKATYMNKFNGDGVGVSNEINIGIWVLAYQTPNTDGN